MKVSTYDPNGNVTKIEEWVDSTHLTAEDQDFDYDTLNRLTSYSGPRGSESYTYRGAEWHRASTTVDGTETKFLYDGDNVLADIEGSTVKKFYVTPFLDQNLSMTDSTGTYYYSQDWLGSVRTLTDSSGNLKNTYDYSGFGEKLAAGTKTEIDNRYTYTGRTDFIHNPGMDYRYRTYAPGIGRFEQRDMKPSLFTFWRSLVVENLYSYSQLSPIYRSDPWGLDDEVYTGTSRIKESTVPIPRENKDLGKLLIELATDVGTHFDQWTCQCEVSSTEEKSEWYWQTGHITLAAIPCMRLEYGVNIPFWLARRTWTVKINRWKDETPEGIPRVIGANRNFPSTYKDDKETTQRIAEFIVQSVHDAASLVSTGKLPDEKKEESDKTNRQIIEQLAKIYAPDDLKKLFEKAEKEAEEYFKKRKAESYKDWEDRCKKKCASLKGKKP